MSVTNQTIPTLSQSLTLQCEVTTVRGITSRVDIVWRRGNRILTTTENVSSSAVNDGMVYRDVYTTGILNESDINAMYRCEVIINMINVTETFTVNSINSK